MQLFKDKKQKCVKCDEEFVLKGGEQAFFLKKGLALPVKCKKCRRKRKKVVRKMNRLKSRTTKVTEEVSMQIVDA